MKPKKYKIVYLKFLDHSLFAPDDAKPIVCEVFGVLWRETDLVYQIVPWVCNGNLRNENNECYTILKSTVLEKRRVA